MKKVSTRAAAQSRPFHSSARAARHDECNGDFTPVRFLMAAQRGALRYAGGWRKLP